MIISRYQFIHWFSWLNRLTISLCFLLTVKACASFNVYEFDNDVKEARFNHLISDLRCPKCQNNNLADSNAPLASDIKKYVYDSVNTGKSDDDITDFLISRYGLFIIYDPKIIWIWLWPLLIILTGLAVAIRNINARRKIPVTDLPSMESLITEHKRNKTNKTNKTFNNSEAK